MHALQILRATLISSYFSYYNTALYQISFEMTNNKATTTDDNIK
jgi:hypothetical protein